MLNGLLTRIWLMGFILDGFGLFFNLFINRWDRDENILADQSKSHLTRTRYIPTIITPNRTQRKNPYGCLCTNGPSNSYLKETISADTARKVHIPSGGKTDTTRVRVNLEIKVASVEYDKEGSLLRDHGKNVSSNGYVMVGAFHTIEIEKNQPSELKKNIWDFVGIDSLQESCNRAAGADLAVVLMQEGLAHLFLIGKCVTKLCARIEGSIPRKNSPAAISKVALSKFFDNVLQAFRKHVEFSVVRCAVIGGPGSIKDEFYRYLLSEAQRLQLKSMIDNKSRLVIVSTSSGSRASLKEVLEDKTVMKLIKDTKAAKEVQAFKDFSDKLLRDADRACYGPKSVEVANELMAVQTLLITDDLFRSADVVTRQKYVNLVKSVEKSGGKAHIFSSMHVSGEQLAQLTGIAAILRFPLPDLDDFEL